MGRKAERPKSGRPKSCRPKSDRPKAGRKAYILPCMQAASKTDSGIIHQHNNANQSLWIDNMDAENKPGTLRSTSDDLTTTLSCALDNFLKLL